MCLPVSGVAGAAGSIIVCQTEPTATNGVLFTSDSDCNTQVATVASSNGGCSAVSINDQTYGVSVTCSNNAATGVQALALPVVAMLAIAAFVMSS